MRISTPLDLSAATSGFDAEEGRIRAARRCSDQRVRETGLWEGIRRTNEISGFQEALHDAPPGRASRSDDEDERFRGHSGLELCRWMWM